MKISEIVLEGLDRHTPSAKEVADKHGVSVDEINSQLKIGIKKAKL